MVTPKSRAAQVFIAPHRARDDAGSPDPVLPSVPISAAGDAGRGRDSQGVRPGALGPSPGPRGSRRVRCGSGRPACLLYGARDALPCGRRARPDHPGPTRAEEDAEEGVIPSTIEIAYPD